MTRVLIIYRAYAQGARYSLHLFGVGSEHRGSLRSAADHSQLTVIYCQPSGYSFVFRLALWRQPPKVKPKTNLLPLGHPQLRERANVTSAKVVSKRSVGRAALGWPTLYAGRCHLVALPVSPTLDKRLSDPVTPTVRRLATASRRRRQLPVFSRPPELQERGSRTPRGVLPARAGLLKITLPLSGFTFCTTGWNKYFR